MRGLIRPLADLVLRTRGTRWGLVACMVAMAALLVLHTVVQTLHLSGSQRADASLGSYEASIQELQPVPLGEEFDPASADAVLRANGAERIAHHLAVRPLGGSPLGRNIGFVEGDVFVDLPEAYVVVQGTPPQQPGEVCASEAIADQAPVGTRHEFYGGALPLTVTCIAEATFRTDSEVLLAAPGTWASAARSGIGEDERNRWASSAAPTTYWSGGDLLSAHAALLVQLGNPDVDYEAGVPSGDLVLRESMVGEQRGFNVDPSPWVLLVPVGLLPVIIGILSGIMSGRLLNRSIETFHRVGLRRSTLRLLSLGVPVVTALVGGAVGVLLGAAMAWGARELVTASLVQPGGPVVGSPTVAGLVFAGLIVGSLLGGWFVMQSGRRRASAEWAWLRLPAIPWPSPWVLVSGAVLCVAAALWVGSLEVSTTTLVAGVVLVGLALVVLTPLAVVRFASGPRQDRRVLLAGRQVVHGAGAWVLMLLFGLQALLAVGGMTAVTSSLGTLNAGTSRLTPLDEVRLEVPPADDADGAQMRSELVALVAADLGDAVYYQYGVIDAMTTQADGLVYTVGSADDAAAFLGVDELAPEARTAFDSGAVLRFDEVDGDRLGFLSWEDEAENPDPIAEAPVFAVPEADDSLRSVGGLMNVAAAEAAGLPVDGEKGTAFTDLTAGEASRAATAADRLGFNSGWLYTPRPPDVFDLPPKMVLGAWILTGLTLVTALVYSAQTAAGLRPLVAGLRAQGLSRRWTRTVALSQLAMVIIWPTVIGVLGGALGLVATVALRGLDMDLFVPWNMVGVLVGGTVAGFILGSALCLRGLHLNERI